MRNLVSAFPRKPRETLNAISSVILRSEPAATPRGPADQRHGADVRAELLLRLDGLAGRVARAVEAAAAGEEASSPLRPLSPGVLAEADESAWRPARRGLLEKALTGTLPRGRLQGLPGEARPASP